MYAKTYKIVYFYSFYCWTSPYGRGYGNLRKYDNCMTARAFLGQMVKHFLHTHLIISPMFCISIDIFNWCIDYGKVQYIVNLKIETPTHNYCFHIESGSTPEEQLSFMICSSINDKLITEESLYDFVTGATIYTQRD